MPDVKDNPFCKNDVLETVQFDLKVKDIDDLLKLNAHISLTYFIALSLAIPTWNWEH